MSADQEKQLREIIRRLRANEISENYAFGRIVAITSPAIAEIAELRERVERAEALLKSIASKAYAAQHYISSATKTKALKQIESVAQSARDQALSERDALEKGK